LKITGIICEYNPLHLGHKKQIDLIKTESNTAVVCLMSGNFVQRGAPAIVDKSLRARAAVECGADLVLELPVTASLSSAEGFAAAGVSVLSQFCTHLCFGAETADHNVLMETARALLSSDFSRALRTELDKGLSFPAARQAALQSMGLDAAILEKPNNILATEYCKAILSQESKLEIMPIFRQGSYHDTAPDPENPSATALRVLMEQGDDWTQYVPPQAAVCFEGTKLHGIRFGERAILSKLRIMTDAEFEALPFGSEGLWRKLMHAVRSQASLEDIISATKSKRYTRTRLDRMILCAFLGITDELLHSPAPYVRVLAFNDTGRQLLKQARNNGSFPNIGEIQDHPYQLLEDRWGDLYGLFTEVPEAAGSERNQRVYYKRTVTK